MPLGASAPTVANDAWVASSATLVGEVDVSNKASVWYGAVVRGEAIGWPAHATDVVFVRVQSVVLCLCLEIEYNFLTKACYNWWMPHGAYQIRPASTPA